MNYFNVCLFDTSAITILRDPVSSIISHYRFNSTAPSIFQTRDHKEHRLDYVVEYYSPFSVRDPAAMRNISRHGNNGDADGRCKARDGGVAQPR